MFPLLICVKRVCVVFLVLCGAAFAVLLENEAQAGESAISAASSAGSAPQGGAVVARRPRLFGRRLYSRQTRPATEASSDAGAPTPAKESKEAWKPLFDGTSLAGWKATKFGGQGDVTVENGSLVLDMGSPLTGITYVDGKDLPRTNFEIRVEARKTAGTDFFCGLTFPVADSYCSFIVGGWGGGLVGLSSIDGNDAARNDTSSHHTFKENQWYTLRVRVKPENISAWIDDKQVVDRNIKGHKITTRSEVDLSQPLGLSNFETRAEVRKIEIRKLDGK